MQAIEFPFSKRRCRYELTERVGLACLVLVTRNPPFSSSCLEVVRLYVAREEVVFGNLIPEREVYPCSEEWGLNGFTYLLSETGKARERLSEFQKQGASRSEAVIYQPGNQNAPYAIPEPLSEK
jgi:hypothetical protein